MKSIRELYKIGNGPSSSHTMGPKKAAVLFKNTFPSADRYIVTLMGSLALTGKGHLTDQIILKALEGYTVEIIFDTTTECNTHPNTMTFEAFSNNNSIGFWKVYSIGGGDIKIEGQSENIEEKEIYDLNKFTDIATFCKDNNLNLAEYVYSKEDSSFLEFLNKIWDAMKSSINNGLNSDGVIPGKLQIQKRAKAIYSSISKDESEAIRKNRLLLAYSYAVCEENASGGQIVTAPTCGSSGILPAVLFYAQNQFNYSDKQIIDALAVSGLIGTIIKTNASVSGAECGCQAEVGSACSMAAAAYSFLQGYDISIIENSAEIAMEHHLGLTCDPVQGYVQIPCIERNGAAAIRAIDSSIMSKIINNGGMISFDTVVDTMYETGKDLSSHYRETSTGGLAKKYVRNKFYNSSIM